MSFFVFPHAKPDLRHQYFHKLTGKLRNLISKNILYTLCLEVGRFQEKPVFLFFLSAVVTHINVLKLVLPVFSYFDFRFLFDRTSEQVHSKKHLLVS